MNATTNKVAVKDERWTPEIGTFYHQLTRTPGQLDLEGPAFLGDTCEARERVMRFAGVLGEFVGIADPVAEIQRLREIERQWNAVHDAQARTVAQIRESLGQVDAESTEQLIEDAILYGCGDSLTRAGTKLFDELAGSRALEDIVHVIARRLGLKPSSKMGQSFVVRDQFNSLVFETRDGEKLAVCMRDSGYEINYEGVWYEAKCGKVAELGTIHRANPVAYGPSGTLRDDVFEYVRDAELGNRGPEETTDILMELFSQHAGKPVASQVIGEVVDWRKGPVEAFQEIIRLVSRKEDPHITLGAILAVAYESLRAAQQPQAPAVEVVSEGVMLITAERLRQVEKEGWTPEHDDEHSSSELALAAAAYAIPDTTVSLETIREKVFPKSWHPSWWKPTPENRVRELVKAGALIAAEIDRLQRVTSKGGRE